jgi:hypothetical protein
MYIYERQKLAEHPMFQQAIILCEMQTNTKWRSIYRDKSGELAVSFYGKLSEDNIKTVLMHFKDLIDGDTDITAISCKYNIDYSYNNEHHANGEKDYTQVFTPDGYNYSQF